MAAAEAVARGRLVAAAARRLVGVRFRPQGRGRNGVDCLGLVLDAIAAAGLTPVLPHFSMVGVGPEQAIGWFRTLGFAPVPLSATIAGDVLLSFPATRQVHLAVRTDDGIIEASAAARRVWERPWNGAAGWDRAWRLPEEHV